MKHSLAVLCCCILVQQKYVSFSASAVPQPSGQSAGDGGAGATNRSGDHRGNGPSHPHQLLRHAQLREPQDGRHQELVAGRPAGRKAVQRGLQVRGAGGKTQPALCSADALMSPTELEFEQDRTQKSSDQRGFAGALNVRMMIVYCH